MGNVTSIWKLLLLILNIFYLNKNKIIIIFFNLAINNSFAINNLTKQAVFFSLTDCSFKVTHYFATKTNDLVIDLIKTEEPQNYNSASTDNLQMQMLVDLSSHNWQQVATEYILDFSGFELPIKSGALRQKTSECLRIICKIESDINYEIFLIPSTTMLPCYLVIEIWKKSTINPLNEIQPQQLRDIMVAIDAGHGGTDPGSIGYDGKSFEKDINLKIAKKLAQLLNNTAGFQALMIRSADDYIGLQERIDIAQNNRVDFFVSIHADGSKNNRACGCSVFVLSPDAAQLEKNRIDKDIGYKINLVGFSDWLDLDNYNWSKRSTDDFLLSQEASNEIANCILSQLAQISKLHQQEVHYQSFAVLKSLHIPSVLVEAGFMTNQTELTKLKNQDYQTNLAQAILLGIINWFYDHPPEHTLVSENKKAKQYSMLI